MNIQDYKKQREEEFRNGFWKHRVPRFTEQSKDIINFNNESIDGAFALIEKEIERLIANTKEHNEADCKYIFAGCSECGKTKTLRDLLSSLKENK